MKRQAPIAIAALLLAGCSVQTPPEVAKWTAPPGVLRYHISRWDDVYVTSLADGTRCAVYVGYKAGGLSCDWNHGSQVERVSP